MLETIAVIFFVLFSVSVFALTFRTIFAAFIKKKDERSKWIVIKSMADSFIVITVMQTILMTVKWTNDSFYQQWWADFKNRIYIEPAWLSILVLGIILIINTKRNGGSL